MSCVFCVGVEAVTCRMKVLSERTARRKDKGAGSDAGWGEVEDDRNSLSKVCRLQRHRMRGKSEFATRVVDVAARSI